MEKRGGMVSSARSGGRASTPWCGFVGWGLRLSTTPQGWREGRTTTRKSTTPRMVPYQFLSYCGGHEGRGAARKGPYHAYSPLPILPLINHLHEMGEKNLVPQHRDEAGIYLLASAQVALARPTRAGGMAYLPSRSSINGKFVLPRNSLCILPFWSNVTPSVKSRPDQFSSSSTSHNQCCFIRHVTSWISVVLFEKHKPSRRKTGLLEEGLGTPAPERQMTHWKQLRSQECSID